MILARRIFVRTEPVPLTERSGTSAVSIQSLKNASTDAVLLVCDSPPDELDGLDHPYHLQPGETMPGLSTGAVDRLFVWSDGTGEIEHPVDVVLGWA